MSSIYERMQNGSFTDDLYWMNKNVDFYQLQLKSGTLDHLGQDLSDITKMMGDWKFHMSIHPDDVPKAWDIVADELMKQEHAMLAKVAKPSAIGYFDNPNSIQAGKQITIYTYKDLSPELYTNLMQKLEGKLDAAGIRPGPLSNADRIIPGSKYSSYRLENGPNGEYVGSSELKHLPKEQRYNPWDAPDPYQDYKMDTGNIPRSPHLESVDTLNHYDLINFGKETHLNGYNITRQETWVQISGKDANFNFLDKTGAKFQISVNPDDLKEAWGIVADELISDSPLHAAKVATPEFARELSIPGTDQAGKFITIYPNTELPIEQYDNLLKRIQDRFEAKNIRPGIKIEGNIPISGSDHLTVYVNQESDLFAHGHHEPHNPYANLDLKSSPSGKPHLSSGQNLTNNLHWQENITEAGDKITRLPIGDMHPNDIIHLENTLKAQGLNPVIHESKTLGSTLRLSGDDVDIFNDMKSLDIGKALHNIPDIHPSIIDPHLWKNALTEGGEIISRIPVGNMVDASVKTLFSALEDAGMKPIWRESATLGPTLRVSGADVDILKSIQKNGILHVKTDNPFSVHASDIDDAAADLTGNMAHWAEKLSSPWVQIGIGTAIGVGTVLLTDATWEDGVGIVIETALPFGEAVTEFMSGDIEGTINASATEIAGIGGAWAGAQTGGTFGAWAGGAIGGIFGAGIGAAPGAVIGGIVGSITGGIIGGIGASIATGYVMNAVPGIAVTIKNVGETLLEHAGMDTDELAEGYENTTNSLVAGKDFVFSAINSGYTKLTNLFNDKSSEGKNHPSMDTDNPEIILASLFNDKPDEEKHYYPMNTDSDRPETEFRDSQPVEMPNLREESMMVPDNSPHGLERYYLVDIKPKTEFRDTQPARMPNMPDCNFDAYGGDLNLLKEALEELKLNVDCELLENNNEQDLPSLHTPLHSPNHQNF